MSVAERAVIGFAAILAVSVTACLLVLVEAKDIGDHSTLADQSRKAAQTGDVATAVRIATTGKAESFGLEP